MKKWFLIPVSLVVLALVMFSIKPITNSETVLKYHSNVCVYVNGELVSCQHNLLTNAGKNAIKDRLGSPGNLNVFDYIALANNTVAQSATDTALQGEWTTCGLSRTQGTFASEGVGNWSITAIFTSSCDDVIVNATGLYNATSGGTLFAETTFPTRTLYDGDSIQIKWYIWVTE